jgi:hypothetical protein
MRVRRVADAVALVVVTVTGDAAVSTAPASASASGGHIHDTGDWVDWWEKGTILSTRCTHINAIAMRPAILCADRKLCRCRRTNTTTELWHLVYGLGVEGKTLKEASTGRRGRGVG